MRRDKIDTMAAKLARLLRSHPDLTGSLTLTVHLNQGGIRSAKAEVAENVSEGRLIRKLSI